MASLKVKKQRKNRKEGQGCTSFSPALPSKHSIASPSSISKWGRSIQTRKPKMTFRIQTTAMGQLHSACLPYVYIVCFSFPGFGSLPVALGQGFPTSFNIPGSSHILILAISPLLFLTALLPRRGAMIMLSSLD